MSKRLIVTGGSGFIGRHCLPLLVDRGYEVHAVHLRDGSGPVPGVYWHRANLHDAEQAGRLLHKVGADSMLHLAWIAQPVKLVTDDDNLRWLQTSLALAKAFRESGGRRLLVTGSCYEYDCRFGWCSEALTPMMPATLYGITKYSLCRVLEEYSRLHGLSFSWARLFFLFGPGEHRQRLAPSIICNLLAERLAPCSSGDQIRDYLYVKDAAEALAGLLDSDLEGCYNIGSSQPVSVRTLATTIARIMGREHLIDLNALPMRADDLPLVLADTSLLRLRLGWEPRYDLERGLVETIEWWRGHVQAPQEAP